MSDLIDRQAVIDLLKQMRKDGDMVPWEGKDVFARIRKLPTIQPEERTEKRTETHGVCLDAISRQQAIDALSLGREILSRVLDDRDVVGVDREKYSYGLKLIESNIEDIKELPPAQPERKKGEWIEISSINHTYKCSECGRLLVNITDGRNNVSKHYPYCHCGADMRGERQK